MKRYHYDKRTAAEWMHEEFGMEFIRADLMNWEVKLWKAEFIEQARHNGRYYIHPDSFNLLEPQKGDLVQYGDDHYGIFREPEPEYRPNFSGIPIFQRDGKPFMWPESE